MTRGKSFGILIIVIIVIAVAVYGTVVVRRGFSARDNPSWLETTLATKARSMSVPSHAKNLKNPIPNTPENVKEGEEHWADHCATCHANNGNGDTVIGKNLYPKAPDMRLADTQNLTDGELYYTIENGIRLSGMPAWGQGGDDDEASWKLVLFIRHLPKLTADEEQHMESLNPKAPGENEEEKEEQEFLNGQSPQGNQSKRMKH
ncbi:MAG TPA: cytochrome c [Candidatus Angelobacter sp.]